MLRISEVLPLWRLSRIGKSWRDGKLWRVGRLEAWLLAARGRRSLLRNVIFIGVTGSAGKTTTKELIASLLSTELPGHSNVGGMNRLINVAQLVWRTSSSDRFCVAELSADAALMQQMSAILQPQIGVVTAIGDDHLSHYGSREAIAREKGKLIEALPADGTAVLNADDHLVAAMGARCRARVITFGLSDSADVRAEDVQGAWPTRLTFTVRSGNERVLLQTQLCGNHFVYSVLAAIAVGLSLGFSLEKCARAVSAVPPWKARMQPVTTPEGIAFIRDDWKAPLWTVAPAFDFMRQARAPRKVIVVGTLSDYGGDASAQYARVAEQALQAADHVVFVGSWSSRALRAARGKPKGTLCAFSTVRQAADHLNSMLQPGDLVLLKGTNRQDHLVRIVLSRSGSVKCWRDDCGKLQFCDACPSLSVPSGPRAVEIVVPEHDGESTAGKLPGHGAAMYIVGLGNPGERYAGTPHNVGQDVLDRLSRTLKAEWVEHEQAFVATQTWNDREICLIKLRVMINRSGPAIRALAVRLGFETDDLVLVHDDLDLPLGTVRTRMRGSAGGHKGVASVIDAFQTDAICRVKLGIGRTRQDIQAIDYVLRPFADEDRPAVDELCTVAEKRILDLVQQRKPTGRNERRPMLDTEAQAHSR